MKKLLISSLVLVLLAACVPSPSESDLVSTNWRLLSLDGTEVNATTGGQAITLEFISATEAGGSGGCNSFGADYSANSDTGAVSFTNLISTLMACEANGVTELEGQYFEALSAAMTYIRSGDSLTISGGGHTLVFVKE